jgi:hypothetical protein
MFTFQFSSAKSLENSHYLRLIIQYRVTSSDRNASERGNDFTVELAQLQEYIRFIHRLQIEVGANHAVAVDNRAAHVGADFRGVGGLNRSGSGRRRGQTIETADEEVEQIRG